MEPRRETNKRAASAAPKQGASKQPQGSEASSSMGGGATNQQTGQQQTGQQQTGQQNQDQDLLQKAKQAGGEIVNQVQQQAGTQIDRGKETAANELSSVVDAVRQFGQNLSGQANGPIARYAAEYGEKAANSLERFANYIREQDAKRLLNDVQNFGRRQPALLIGGAFLLGFAGARLIRSSMDAASQHSANLDYRSSPYYTEVPPLDRNAPVAMPRPGAGTV
ncbi:MAG TPA: hypothetical protein VF290_06835 [Pyrinomonadaceae bacterium]